MRTTPSPEARLEEAKARLSELNEDPPGSATGKAERAEGEVFGRYREADGAIVAAVAIFGAGAGDGPALARCRLERVWRVFLMGR